MNKYFEVLFTDILVHHQHNIIYLSFYLGGCYSVYCYARNSFFMQFCGQDGNKDVRVHPDNVSILTQNSLFPHKKNLFLKYFEIFYDSTK